MRPVVVVRTSAVEGTRDLARTLANLVSAGDLIVLAGEMGAGKTAFAQGFAEGLGVADRVTSPTFTIVREYVGRDLALHHLDVYRLDQLREVLELGIAEMLDEDAVMLVEWGDAVLPALGDQYLEVRLAFGEGDDDRMLAFTARGARWAARDRILAEALAPWSVADASPDDPTTDPAGDPPC